MFSYVANIFNVNSGGYLSKIVLFLLEKYLGRFILDKISVNQLKLDISCSDGIGAIDNVNLDVQSINEIAGEQNWSFEIIYGHVERIRVIIPWASLQKESICIEIYGLNLTIQPKQRTECDVSVIESMWSSMHSSEQIAEELIKIQDTSFRFIHGTESMVFLIDSVLSKIKLKCIDTTINVEYPPENSTTGVGLQFCIPHVEYFNVSEEESPKDGPAKNPNEEPSEKPDGSSVDNLYRYLKFDVIDLNVSSYEFLVPSRNSESDDYEATADSVKNVIPLAKISGKQEIKISWKKNEDDSGPKMSVECNLANLSCFMSPRQLYLVTEVINGFLFADSVDDNVNEPTNRPIYKRMTEDDFARFETEFYSQAQNQQQGLLNPSYGWSENPMEESGDGQFVPMKNAKSPMTESATSVASSSASSMTSSMFGSSAAATDQATSTRRRVNRNESDPSADILNFKITLSSAAIVLLHEDVVAVSYANHKVLIPSTVVQMQNMSRRFFEGYHFLNRFDADEFEAVSKRCDEEIKLPSHLRFLSTSIELIMKDTKTPSTFLLNGELNAVNLSLVESVTDSADRLNVIKLLDFPAGNCPDAHNPNVTVTFKHVERTSRSGRSANTPKTDVHLSLRPCVVDVDITLVDRLKCLLDPVPVFVVGESPSSLRGLTSTASLTAPCDKKVEIKLTSPSIIGKLRFPMLDFRAPTDANRTPWYKRSVRPDFLLLQFENVSAQTTRQTSQNCESFVIECNSLDVFYFENETREPLHVARTAAGEKFVPADSAQRGKPRIILKVCPEAKSEKLDELFRAPTDESIMSQSVCSALMDVTAKTMGGPFSANIYKHKGKIDKEGAIEDIVVPGERHEINQFTEATMRNSRVQLEIFLPIASVQLPSIHIYEVLYNRINSDLLLWEPSAPKFNHPQMGELPNISNYKYFSAFKAKGNDSDSDSDNGDVFHSFLDARGAAPATHARSGSQSSFSVNVQIVMGLLSVNTPVRDTQGKVVPNMQGEFVFHVNGANVFSVNGYEGKPTLGYACVQVLDAKLLHCEMRSVPMETPRLPWIDSAVAKHLHATIHQSERGVLQTATNSGGKRHMVSVAIRIEADDAHTKNVVVSVGLNKATLRHRTCQSPNTWISQLIDFFNVDDYPIPGYIPREVLTHLHLNLWDCAIDYRPRYIPLRSVVTIGSFNLMSSTSLQSHSTKLRFIAENAWLFVSDKAPPKDGRPSNVLIDLQRDFVNVVDVEMFELTLTLNDEKGGLLPLTDLSASSTGFHVRTCADTATALMQLVTYMANDGDTRSGDGTPCGSYNSSPRHVPADQKLVAVEPREDIVQVTKDQRERVNQLLGDAMEESISSTTTSDIGTQYGEEQLFFFPDERRNSNSDEMRRVIPQVRRELGEATSSNTADIDLNEYCIIEPSLPKGSLPIIEWQSDSPIQIVEDHFTKLTGKVDQLEAPDFYPPAVVRYTLQDMSVTWHIFDGNDFGAPEKIKKGVNFNDATFVSYSKPSEVTFTEQRRTPSKSDRFDWRRKGGANRNMDVEVQVSLKNVQFRYDVFPEDGEYASRQVLLIKEIVMRDRLKNSAISKLMHEYATDRRPKPTNSSMVVVKAFFVRPDPKLKRKECNLKISVHPIKINLHQETASFLMSYVGGLQSTAKTDDGATSKHSTPTHQPPIMTVDDNAGEAAAAKQPEEEEEADDNLLMLHDETVKEMRKRKSSVKVADDYSDDLPVYINSFMFVPSLDIHVDYYKDKFELTAPGMLMPLTNLNVTLVSIYHRRGIAGVDKLISHCFNVWYEDIKMHQLQKMVQSITLLQPVIQLFSGVWDFIRFPVLQYQKDGRIIKGFQRGTVSLYQSAFLAAMSLISRALNIVRLMAETLLIICYSTAETTPTRYNRPLDFREGVTMACNVVKDGLAETTGNLIRIASHEHEQKGYRGAVGGIVRQIPATVVKPIILLSDATNKVIEGAKCQLVDEFRNETKEKWKREDDL